MKTCSLLIILSYSIVLCAQSPLAFNYQGIARDQEGNIYANQNISLELSLVRNSEAGPVDFTEEHFPVTNDFGLFTVQIGKGDPILGNLNALDWSKNQYFISVGFDPDGGRDFSQLGVTQLLSVPYAMHAQTASNASGAGSDDQILDLNGSVLTIEGGNSVDLGMLSGSSQTLNIQGDELSISGGNTITLPNPAPQTLSVSGNQLSISSGNTVALPTGTGSTLWTESGNSISYTDGPAAVSDLRVLNNNNITTRIFNSAGGAGHLELFDASGKSIMTLTNSTTNLGFIGVKNPANEQTLTYLTGTSSNAGFLGTLGPNSNINVALTNLGTNPDHGFVAVYDASDNIKASLYVNSNGQGVINADISTTSSPHPGRSSQNIVYSSLSGPEVGLYHRGQAQLSDGRGEIILPDHFRILADSSSYTIILTPYSLQSKGLAVDQETETGFIIGELFDGNGTYRFDWEVKAIRKGYKDFEVIREKEASGQVSKIE